MTVIEEWGDALARAGSFARRWGIARGAGGRRSRGRAWLDLRVALVLLEHNDEAESAALRRLEAQAAHDSGTGPLRLLALLTRGKRCPEVPALVGQG